MCFVVRKTTSKLEHAILTILYLVGVKNTDSWHARKGDLQCTFPVDVPMVPSSTITIADDGERLTFVGFSLSETVHLGSLEFIINYFGSLSLYPRRGDSGTAFMGSTSSRTLSPQRAMIENSVEEFLTVLSGEGGCALTYPRRRDTGVSLLPSQPHHGWRTLRLLRL
jgi:hypothetical protein